MSDAARDGAASTERPAAVLSPYQRGWRRMLVDMEIPAWDERFLADFDATAMADLYQRAGASAVMFSCKALTGMCFWPTDVGPLHPAMDGRDVIAETVEALANRGIAACAYYSAIYDNWAFESHPDWRLEHIGGWRRRGRPYDRHGTCCPNSPGYRQYVCDQIADLYGRYDFSCAFCDMSYWPGICGCQHCRDRFRAEDDLELPETINWTSPEWCRFQAARERWISDFQALVTAAIREARPRIAVYHNFSIGPIHWLHSVPFDVTEHSDFLGGDHYGDDLDQLVVTKLMNNLSRSRPVEYMTGATVDLFDHVRLKPPERMRAQVLAATCESAALMFINGIDPSGTANAGDYDAVRQALDAAAPFEPYLGGEPIEDVAVYFSNESKLDFSENGAPISDPPSGQRDYDREFAHMDAVRGACRVLQRAHIPFGIITRRQLGELDRYRVVVLPNIARMDSAEVEAIRGYVHRGGCVYASKYTSLVETRGVRHDDFMLADLFGVKLETEESCRVVYAKPASGRCETLITPQKFLSGYPGAGSLDGGLLRVTADRETEVLATLSLPYARPHVGDALDQRWASIHSSPPWEHTQSAAIVERKSGAGRVIYSAWDIEREDAAANDRLFAGLIRDLLAERWSLQCDSDPRLHVSAFHRPDQHSLRIALLNLPPAIDTAATLRLRPPAGARFVALEQIPTGTPLPLNLERDGALQHTIDRAAELTMLHAHYK